MDNFQCPQCHKKLDHVEICNEDCEEIKDAFNCQDCNMIVYTHRFKDANGNVNNIIPGDYDGPFNHKDLEELKGDLVEAILKGIKEGQVFSALDFNNYYIELEAVLKSMTEETLKGYFKSDLIEADGCLHDFQMQPGCGVRVCTRCDEHEGLARCYCGWNLAPGERLEDDVPY